MSPDISVIVVSWNAVAYLPRCLGALAGQRLAPREIIVVDNASSDGSCALLRARYPEVELIVLDHNLGFAAANNLAARRAKGEWIALLNPDAFPEPDWLDAFARVIEEYPAVPAFTGKLLQDAWPERLDGTGDVYHVSGLCWRRDHGSLAREAQRPLGPVFSACGASAVFRKDVFLALNGFDEDFFCYLEDVDLGFRLRLQGHDCLYVPAAVARHVGSGTTGRRSDISVYYGQRNLTWVYLKNMPGWLFWMYLPLHLVMTFSAVIWLGSRGQGGVVLRAKRDAFKGAAEMLQKRAAIQARRRVGGAGIRNAMVRGLGALLTRG